MIQFDEQAHRYTLDGRELPSVTQALTPLVDLSGIPGGVLAYAADRGTAVHKACELHDRGELDYASIADELTGYLAAWMQFLHDTRFVPNFIELRVWSEQYRYAGTLDRAGTIGKRNVLLDIKTTVELSPAVGVQLAGYEHALRERGYCDKRIKIERFAVQLRRDGAYRMEKYEELSDWPAFLACLQLYQFRRKHGYQD